MTTLEACSDHVDVTNEKLVLMRLRRETIGVTCSRCRSFMHSVAIMDISDSIKTNTALIV